MTIYYNLLNTTGIHESLLTEINKQMIRKNTSYVECQPINTDRLTETENHHLATIPKKMSVDAKAVRQRSNEQQDSNIISEYLCTRYESITKGKMVNLMWGDLANTNLTRQSRLTSLVVGQVDIICLQVPH